MAQFTVNAHAVRSVQELQVPGEVGRPYVAGVSKVSALKRTTEVVKHREGGDPSSSRKSPGRTEYEADHPRARRHPRHRVRAVGQQGLELRLRPRAPRSRSRTSARTSSSRSTTRPASSRIAYKVFRCWVSEFQALPDLDANANAVAIQHHQAGERGLGARLRRHRADGAVVRRAVTPAAGLAAAGPAAAGLGDPALLLDAWDAASAAHDLARGGVLLAVIGAVTPDGAADLPLGVLGELALRCHIEAFGSRLDGVVSCPTCAGMLEVVLTVGRPAGRLGLPSRLGCPKRRSTQRRTRERSGPRAGPDGAGPARGSDR